MKMLTCRTEKAVAGWVVAELIFTEQTRSDRGTALRTRHVRVDPDFLAGLDVLDLEIAPVGHDRDPLHAETFLGRFGSLCQQTHIHHLVGDLLLDDQLVFGTVEALSGYDLGGDFKVPASSEGWRQLQERMRKGLEYLDGLDRATDTCNQDIKMIVGTQVLRQYHEAI